MLVFHDLSGLDQKRAGTQGTPLFRERARMESVAVSAADIAPLEPDENMALTDPGAFALNRRKNFVQESILHSAIIQNNHGKYKPVTLKCRENAV